MQVTILAGGLATRLGGLARNKPKSMLEIGGKPFLEHQIELLRQGGVRDIVLCLGYLGAQIQDYFADGRRYGVSINYSFEEKLLGTAGALKQAAPLLNSVFFTLYGDSYVFVDYGAIMSYFESKDRLALMTIHENHDRWDKSNVAVEDSLVKKYSKSDKTPDMVYLDYGLNILRKEALELVPDNQVFPLEDLFPELIRKEELLAYEIKKRFYEIGSPQGFTDFKEFIEAR